MRPFILLTILVCAGISQAQRLPPKLQPAQTSRSGTKPPLVRPNGRPSNSNSLITVPAVVMDRNGRYIGNLRRDDFKIFEDGVEQNLAYFASVEKPFTVALMLDVSGSTQSQLSQIRDAANTFVSRLRYIDRM